MKKNLKYLDHENNLAIIYMYSPPNNLIYNKFLDPLQETILKAKKIMQKQYY